MNSCRVSYIYTLVDPFDGTVRYIGHSDDPKHRYKEHLQDARNRADTEKKWWILKLLMRGAKPRLVVLKCVPYQDRLTEESLAIQRARSLGHPLTNRLEWRNPSFHDSEATETIVMAVRRPLFHSILVHFSITDALAAWKEHQPG